MFLLYYVLTRSACDDKVLTTVNLTSRMTPGVKSDENITKKIKRRSKKIIQSDFITQNDRLARDQIEPITVRVRQRKVKRTRIESRLI